MIQSKIYIGNLPSQIGSSELEEHFGQYGAVKEIRIIKDHETGQSRGFGFIEFETSDSADKALDSNGVTILGNEIKVSYAKTRSPNSNRPRYGGNEYNRDHKNNW